MIFALIHNAVVVGCVTVLYAGGHWVAATALLLVGLLVPRRNAKGS